MGRPIGANERAPACEGVDIITTSLKAGLRMWFHRDHMGRDPAENRLEGKWPSTT
jgi:hypothetical protein